MCKEIDDVHKYLNIISFPPDFTIQTYLYTGYNLQYVLHGVSSRKQY